MELSKANPFVRFADKLRFEFQRGPSKTYDCRFLYTFDGDSVVQVEGVDYSVSRGSLVMFQPNTQYTIYPKPTVDMIVLDFDFTQDYSDNDGFLIPCPISSFLPGNAHILQHFRPEQAIIAADKIPVINGTVITQFGNDAGLRHMVRPFIVDNGTVHIKNNKLLVLQNRYLLYMLLIQIIFLQA